MKKTALPERLRVVIRGAVQGVGFRPFAYRLATEMALPGWVSNSPQGVFLEVEGAPDTLRAFLLRLEQERPPRSSIQSLEYSFLPLIGFQGFAIRPARRLHTMLVARLWRQCAFPNTHATAFC